MLGSNLQNMLSINVPFLFENRVGKVICGHRLCAINRSKKSQYIICTMRVLDTRSDGDVKALADINALE